MMDKWSATVVIPLILVALMCAGALITKGF